MLIESTAAPARYRRTVAPWSTHTFLPPFLPYAIQAEDKLQDKTNIGHVANAKLLHINKYGAV